VSPTAGLDGCGIRSPDRPARSELLYRLSYPGPQNITGSISNHGKGEGKGKVKLFLYRPVQSLRVPGC